MGLVVRPFPRAELAKLISMLSQMPDCHWVGDPESFATEQGMNPIYDSPPIGQVELDMVTSKRVGQDDQIHTFDDPTQTNQPTQVGWRQHTISVACKTFGDTPAYDVLELIRTRMQRQNAQLPGAEGGTAQSVLESLNLAFIRFGPSVEYQEDSDGRPLFVSKMDLILARCIVEEPDTDDGAWIDTVNGGGPLPFVPST